MADEEWLKNLAGASFQQGKWVHDDPTAVERLSERRLAEAVTDLYQAAAAAAEVFNLHAGHDRQLRVLAIAPAAASPLGGFMLLCGRAQLSLQHKPPMLEASLLSVQSFRRSSRPLHRFKPRLDPFGSLVWVMDNALLMTGELIIKRLFEDVIRAASEAGGATKIED